MKNAGSTVVILLFLSVYAHSQNLVKNPGFEAFTKWDSLWVLSYTDPSTSTAVAMPNTTVFHTGSRSLELRNDKSNMWTYMYSDSVNAPILFTANKTYKISGWIKVLEQGKGASLSIYWNNSMNRSILYAGNPDPITTPEWFLVVDTITPESEFADGYLCLGMRAGKMPPATVGRILFDDLSVVRLPDNKETEIIDFSIPEQVRPAMIDPEKGTITLDVPGGTDITSLAPDRILLSRGATVVPEAGVPVDFTEPVTYTVTAQDEMTTQHWIITVLLPPSTETDILEFSVPEETGPADIDTASHEVHVEVKYGTDLTALSPVIRVSEGAWIESTDRTTYDFTFPVVYMVIAEDGKTMQEWTVYVKVAEPSEETDITSFSIEGLDGAMAIDTVSHLVTYAVPYGTVVDALVPLIEVSPGAVVDPAGGSPVDFTNPVLFTVTAEDGVTFQNWTVIVVVLPNTETEILAFSFNEQTGPALIDNENASISIEVEKDAGLTSLVPHIEVSPGATVDPPGEVATDFSNDVVYTVTAEDGLATQEWTVTVTLDPALSIPRHPAAPPFRMYPNPAHDLLTVDVPLMGDLVISDLMGRTVRSVDQALGRMVIPLDGLPQGTYFVRFRHPDGYQLCKFIIR